MNRKSEKTLNDSRRAGTCMCAFGRKTRYRGNTRDSGGQDPLGNRARKLEYGSARLLDAAHFPTGGRFGKCKHLPEQGAHTSTTRREPANMVVYTSQIRKRAFGTPDRYDGGVQYRSALYVPIEVRARDTGGCTDLATHSGGRGQRHKGQVRSLPRLLRPLTLFLSFFLYVRACRFTAFVLFFCARTHARE